MAWYSITKMSVPHLMSQILAMQQEYYLTIITSLREVSTGSENSDNSTTAG